MLTAVRAISNNYKLVTTVPVSVNRGGSRNFWLGGGGPNFGLEGTGLFCGKLRLPHTPSHQSWLHAGYNSLAPYRVVEFFS